RPSAGRCGVVLRRLDRVWPHRECGTVGQPLSPFVASEACTSGGCTVTWSNGFVLPVKVMCPSLYMRSIMCGERSSNAGRSDRIFGSSVPLCRGGGVLVAHASELPWRHG